MPLETKNTQKNENWTRFIKSLHMQQCSLRGCIRPTQPPPTHFQLAYRHIDFLCLRCSSSPIRLVHLEDCLEIMAFPLYLHLYHGKHTTSQQRCYSDVVATLCVCWDVGLKEYVLISAFDIVLFCVVI